MIQAKFSLEEEHVLFLNKHKEHGFKDRSAVIRSALELLKEAIEKEKLRRSAALYAELYHEDQELQDITDSARHGWPE